MNAREKKLAIIVGALFGLFAVVFLARGLFLGPLRAIDKKMAAVSQKLQGVQKERKAFFAAESSLKKVAVRLFSDDVDQAHARSGEMLTKAIRTCGLREADFSRLPIGPSRMRGASEIGWSVQGEGSISNVVDLLFLLEKSPYLHRLENLVLTAADQSGNLRVRFRFLTLVLVPPPAVDPAPLPDITLTNAQRELYSGIVDRDILRPYIKRPPTPPPQKDHSPSQAPAGPPPPGPETFQIVSLSDWKGHPEVHVRDLTRQKTLVYQAGDELAGGTVVMVDYRSLPMHGNPLLNSFSRVILRINDEFWAIDHGKTMADKYPLAPEQLPERLSKL